MTEDSAKWNSNRRRGPSPSSTFPAKLFQILSNPEFSHIITWMPHGRSWRVLQPKVFSEVVSPKYFSHQSKYSSFMRQVNGWGFKRITRGPDRNSYYHELFVRDNPELAWTMSRRGSSSSKNAGGKDEADKEPNFYEMTGLANSAASTGSGANPSGAPNQLYPPGAAGAGGYDYHDGHGHLYNGNYDLTHGGALGPHQYVPSQSLGADQQPPFHPYGGGGSSNQGSGGNFPEEYSNYPPNYHAPSSAWPSSNYPSAAFAYQQGFYSPYGPPSQYFPSAVTPPVSEERPVNAAAHPNGQAGWSEEGGQHPFPGYTGQGQPLHPGNVLSQQADSSSEPQQGHGWFRDNDHQGLR